VCSQLSGCNTAYQPLHTKVASSVTDTSVCTGVLLNVGLKTGMGMPLIFSMRLQASYQTTTSPHTCRQPRQTKCPPRSHATPAASPSLSVSMQITHFDILSDIEPEDMASSVPDFTLRWVRRRPHISSIGALPQGQSQEGQLTGQTSKLAIILQRLVTARV
jgi:hypothetical protein